MTQPILMAQPILIAQPAFDVVVCARNNRAIIGDTLTAVSRLTWAPASCVVVDGRSTDGTPEFVRDNFEWAGVVVKDKDNGPAASRNLGAARGTSPWVLFLDSDVILAPDWVERQIFFIESRPRCMAAAGKLLQASGPELLDMAYGLMNRYGIAWHAGEGEPSSDYSQPQRCIWNPTAAFMVNRQALAEVGGFDELMFAYHEDTDFGWRANLFGFEVGWNPDAEACHRPHSTMNKSSMGHHRAFLAYRNRLRSALINYELPHFLRYMSVHLLLFVAQAFVSSPRRARWRSLWWNVRMLPDTLKRRRFVQSRRRVRDRDLWPLFEKGFRGRGYE
jgi:GT2 family glycosyltransferase